MCRATRAAPDCTRVRRRLARLYQVGVALCWTRQVLRLGAAAGVLTGHEVALALPLAPLPASSSAPPAMLGDTDVPLFHGNSSNLA